MLDPHTLRLYVLTHADPARHRGHRDVAVAAVEGGATAIQLRAPDLEDRELVPLAEELRDLCRAAGVLFIVNDRPEVAAQVDADGVHVGQRDDPSTARRRVHRGAIVGVSVQDVAQARAAVAAGADYLAVTMWRTAHEVRRPADGPGDAGGRWRRPRACPSWGSAASTPRTPPTCWRPAPRRSPSSRRWRAAPDPVAATAELRAAVDGYLVERAGR